MLGMLVRGGGRGILRLGLLCSLYLLGAFGFCARLFGCLRPLLLGRWVASLSLTCSPARSPLRLIALVRPPLPSRLDSLLPARAGFFCRSVAFLVRLFVLPLPLASRWVQSRLRLYLFALSRPFCR